MSQLRRWLRAPVQIWFGVSPLPLLILLLNFVFGYYYGWFWYRPSEGKLDRFGRTYATRGFNARSQTGWLEIEYYPPWPPSALYGGAPWKEPSGVKLYQISHDERVQPLPGRWGFEYHVMGPFAAPVISRGWCYYDVRLPHWALLLAAGLLTVPSLRRYARRRHRRTAGLCLRCGYDLRGSPGLCPECGSPTVAGTVPGGTPAVPGSLTSRSERTAAR